MHHAGLLLALLVTAAAASPYQPHNAKPASAVRAKEVDYRLPTDVVPDAYIVCMVPYLDDEGDKSFTFDGTVHIHVHAARATDVITLHSSGLSINEAATEVLEPVSNTKLAVAGHEFEPVTEFLRIKLAQQLQVDTVYEIRMEFNGTLSEEMNGFYRSSYKQGVQTKWMATTQFQPTHARKAFPCFDEPAMKATFTLNIARKYDVHHVLSNMPLKETSPPDLHVDGRVWDTFHESPRMSSYLVAFIVSDFHNLTTDTVSVWARQDAIYQGAYAQQVGPPALLRLEEFTGIPYLLPKMDHVAISDFSAGAMENWGLLTYRETSLLYDPAESTESNRQRVATVVAHEIAHMWFGNLVTLDWWGYTWLNEGFARYLQYVATALVETEWQLLDQFVVDQLQMIFRADALVNSPALSNPKCASPADISAMFGATSYSKGGAVLRMMDHVLTRPTFQKGLHNYLQNNSLKNTVPDQLFAELDAAARQDGVLPSDIDVKTIMDTWTLKPGYPYITVSRTEFNRSLEIKQQRFLLQPNASDPDTSLWHAPLTWTRETDDVATAFQNTRPETWIRIDNLVVILPTDIGEDEWIIFNNQQTGYYRVAYDESLWNSIIAALMRPDFASRIHVVNRAQIIDDALNLARAGVTAYYDALQATRYLKEELDYIPWVAAFNGFSYLESRLVTSEGFDYFKSYVLSSLAKVYDRVTFTEGADDKQTAILNRVNVVTWACKYQLADCVDRARGEFDAWRNDPAGNTRISPNKKSVVYCTAMKTDTDTNWNFLWQQYILSDLGTEQVLILAALGCTNDKTLLNSYLLKSIADDSGIRKQDAPSVFSSVYNNPDGVDTALDFLVNNYPEIQAHYVGSNALSNAITGIAAKLTTRQQVDKLRAFIADNAAALDDNTSAAGAKAIEAAEVDLAWTERHAATILDWMRDEVYATGSAHAHTASGVVVVLTSVALALAAKNVV